MVKRDFGMGVKREVLVKYFYELFSVDKKKGLMCGNQVLGPQYIEELDMYFAV
jgi:hypothetical protein